MEALYEIYLITNLQNNKKYVGQTHLDRHELRWEEHKKDSRHFNRLLYNALKKDKKNNYIHFKFEVLETNIAENLIDQKEIEYIKFYNSYYLYDNGYNMTLGGQGMHGYMHTDKDKEKISEGCKAKWAEIKQDSEYYKAICQHRSEVATGKIFSKEHRAKLSKIASQRTGNKNPFYGKHFEGEILEKSRAAHSKNVKDIYMYDCTTKELLQVFRSASEAARFIKKEKSGPARILAVCHAGKGMAYGYIWRFK